MGTVCAIILNYRNTQETLNCLASLDPASLAYVHLVDNSESPDEEANLRAAADSLGREPGHPPINLIVNPENMGYAKSVNAAIVQDLRANRQFDYYFLINNDAIGETGLVSALRKAIESDHGVVAVSPSIVEDGLKSCIKWYEPWFGVTSSRRTSLSVPYITGCCLMVEASFAEDGRLFDEDFFMYGEDIWLCMQILGAGKSVRCVDDQAVEHKGAGSSRKGSLFYEYHMARAQVLIATKSSRNVLDLLVKHLFRFAYLGLRSIVRSIRYRNLSPMLSVPLAWFRLEVRP